MKLCDKNLVQVIGVGKEFLFDARSKSNGRKYMQIRFHQTKELLQNKWNNQQSENTIYRMGKYLQPVSDKGLLSGMYKKLKQQ